LIAGPGPAAAPLLQVIQQAEGPHDQQQDQDLLQKIRFRWLEVSIHPRQFRSETGAADVS
jgi:hypothetical protein